MGTIRVGHTNSPIAPTAGTSALSFPTGGANSLKWVDADGGTNILSMGGFTLTVPATGTTTLGTGTSGRVAEWAGTNTVQASTLVKTGVGVLTLSAASAYTLTVPATGTAALLGTANTFTAAQTISVSSGTGFSLNGTLGVTFQVSGAAGQSRDFIFSTATVARWILRTNGTAEAGSDAGSDLNIISRTDAGANKATVISIIRSTGNVLIGTTTDAGYRLNIDAGAMRLAEMVAPSAPAANGVVIYAVDNGAGKTQLMALFSSGAAQQLAIQP